MLKDGVVELDLNTILTDARYVKSFYSETRELFYRCLCAMPYNESLLMYCKESLENIDSTKKLRFVNRLRNVKKKKSAFNNQKLSKKQQLGWPF